ncbi:GIY-YIG nuclease family protein [Pseudodesulfovibrio sp. zrk46]|uniref:GIY-YIG nuclease family protein n=1 Tax=Pseudodesulfovibrio sp. zrk46 TaxID=2725288 RepID=UPI0014494952|nr:GIY-YIG nuclease family protein [Pseudodesulfovibrio sp. zrk46]QJB57998.1 GIY-YIG nuclease family protein [Pseudodesulfovibrio sp. zrk46]
MSNWFVYLLRCADDTLYCGITTDVDRRILQHNAGTGAKYTRPRRPVTLEALTEVDTKGDALRVEILVKKQPRKRKISYLVCRDWESDLERLKS